MAMYKPVRLHCLLGEGPTRSATLSSPPAKLAATLSTVYVLTTKGDVLQVTPAGPKRLPFTSPVLDVACGTDHAVFLLSTRSPTTVYGLGDNSYCQLGSNDMMRAKAPTPMRLLAGKTPTALYAGERLTAAACLAGFMLIGGNPNPAPVEAQWFSWESFGGARLKTVGIGLNHVIASTGGGSVYFWGSQTAEGADVFQPIKIDDALWSERATKVAADAHASYVLTESGKVFAWGSVLNAFVGVDTPGYTTVSTMRRVFRQGLWGGMSVTPMLDGDGFPTIGVMLWSKYLRPCVMWPPPADGNRKRELMRHWVNGGIVCSSAVVFTGHVDPAFGQPWSPAAANVLSLEACDAAACPQSIDDACAAVAREGVTRLVLGGLHRLYGQGLSPEAAVPADLVLVVDGHRMWCHRHVVCAASPVLTRLLAEALYLDYAHTVAHEVLGAVEQAVKHGKLHYTPLSGHPRTGTWSQRAVDPATPLVPFGLELDVVLPDVTPDAMRALLCFVYTAAFPNDLPAEALPSVAAAGTSLALPAAVAAVQAAMLGEERPTATLATALLPTVCKLEGGLLQAAGAHAALEQQANEAAASPGGDVVPTEEAAAGVGEAAGVGKDVGVEEDAGTCAGAGGDGVDLPATACDTRVGAQKVMELAMGVSGMVSVVDGEAQVLAEDIVEALGPLVATCVVNVEHAKGKRATALVHHLLHGVPRPAAAVSEPAPATSGKKGKRSHRLRHKNRQQAEALLARLQHAVVLSKALQAGTAALSSDVQVVAADGSLLPTQRCLLAACLPALDVSAPTVVLDAGVTRPAAVELLRLVATGEVRLSRAVCDPLLRACTVYDLPALRAHVEQFAILNCVSPDTVDEFIDIAASHNAARLLAFAGVVKALQQAGAAVSAHGDHVETTARVRVVAPVRTSSSPAVPPPPPPETLSRRWSSLLGGTAIDQPPPALPDALPAEAVAGIEEDPAEDGAQQEA